MGSRLSRTMRGFLLPAIDQIALATLLTSSVYTQAGPRPGSPVAGTSTSRAQLQTSGEQSFDLRFTARAAGQALLNGATWSYRKSTDASTADRGWNAPNVPTGWAPCEMSTSTTYTLLAAATIPSSQKVVVVYTDGTTLYSNTYNPTAWTWGTKVTIGTYTRGAIWCSGAWLAERLYVVAWASGGSELLYSDDSGATWTAAANKPLPGSGSFPSTSTIHPVARLVGDDVCLVTSQSTNVNQYASTNSGTSFSLVTQSTATYDNVSMCVTPQGQVIVVVRKNSDSLPYSFTVSSAFEPFTNATAVPVDASQTLDGDLGCWADLNGDVYVTARKGASLYLWRSTDAGLTWKKFDWGLWGSGDATSYLTVPVATPCLGGTLLLHQWTANTGTGSGKSIASLRCGGWDAWTPSEDVGSTATYHDERLLGFGKHASNASLTWLPFDSPTNTSSWTKVSSGTTHTDTLGSGFTTLVTTGTGIQSNSANPGTSSTTAIAAFYEIQMTSGGATSGSTVCGSDIVASTGAASTDSSVQFSTTAIRLATNSGGTTLATVNIDTTAAIYEILHLHWHTNVAEAYYRLRGTTQWTLIGSGACTIGASATASVKWGHNNSGTATSKWSMFQFFAANFTVGAAGNAAWPWGIGISPTANAASAVQGANLSQFPIALGDMATAGAVMARSVDGQALIGDTQTIAAVYDYGVDRVFPSVSPSPSEAWRSLDTAGSPTVEATLEFQLSSSVYSYLGGQSLAMYLGGCNFKTAYLEGYNGAAWVTLGTYNGAVDYAGLTWDRVAATDTITPNTSTASASRYTQDGELVNGYADLGSNKIRKIAAHEPGSWTGGGSTATKLTRLRLTGIDNTEGTTGTCSIWRNEGLLVVHNVSTIYQKYRLRIPAQYTYEGYLQLGIFLAGPLVVFGTQWGRGWTHDRAPNVTAIVDRYGTSRRRQEGPPRRRWTLAWPDGIPVQNLRSSLNNDFLSAKAGYAALAAQHDAPWLTWGLLADCKSGEIPIVGISKMPDASSADTTNVTDPTLILYGRLDSSVQNSHVVGDEGVSEFLRGEPITLTEIV